MNDIDNSQLTKQQQKKTVNEKRRSYTKAILGAEHFTEALQYKLALEAEGVSVDSNIYYELFFRCTDYQTVCELKEEIMSNAAP